MTQTTSQLDSSRAVNDYSRTEELCNIISHLIGLILSTLGLILLVQKAQGAVAITSVAVYGASLALMFLASCIYHGSTQPERRRQLKILDHSAIYLLIAGTYTPYLLIALTGWVSIASIIFIWFLAIAGVGFKLFAGQRFPKISLATYLAMGWFALVIGYPLYQAVAANGMWLLLAGGICFSVGVIFYVAKHKEYTHALWHLFVMGGCACHFFSIYYYVL